MTPEAHIFRERQDAFTVLNATEYVSSFQSGRFGCLWLRHPSGTQLAVMVNGSYSYPHFFPAGDHPGWQIAPSDDADWETEIDFRADNGEPTPMPLALVICTKRVTEVIQNYWQDGEMPNTEQWTSLIEGEP
ncbi:MAG: hypothetical protein AAF802_28180 [Planctomycetota bacterium]